jgi:hypothetical protein
MPRRFLILLLTLSCLLGAMIPGPAKADPSPWLRAEESGGIVYFVYSSPPRIRRYSLAGAAWLADIPLAEAPTAFTVDDGRLYISFGRRTSRFALDGSGEVHLKNTAGMADTLFVLGNALYIASYSNYLAVDKLSGAQIDAEEDDFFYSLQGVDVAPSRRKAFGRSNGVSPSDIVVININADGTFGEQEDSPYHGDFPSAEQTWVFPGEARVADNSGIVYNTGDLTYSNSLGGRFQDLAFYGDLPVVLRDGEVIAYSNAFLETGRYKPAHTPLKIAVRGDQVFSFYQGPGGLEAEHFPISLLQPEEPGAPVDPNGLAYAPDQMLMGKDNVLYILSRANLSVFRWSVVQQRYLETIPLTEAAGYMAYSATDHRLYLSYPSGAIRQIRLAESTHETPFVNSPQTPCGLATADQYLFVCDPSGAWGTHYTYSPSGALIDQREWNYYSREYTWSEPHRRMYFFRDSFSPNDVHWEEVKADGRLGEAGESPYHGEIGTIPPIRVSPDGSTLLLGSGEIFDALTLVRKDSLSNNVSDAGWLQGTLFTIRPLDGGSELQKWGANYGVTARRTLEGTPLRLFARPTDLLVVTSVSGIPRFTLWNSSLGPTVPAQPMTLADGRFSVSVSWQTPDGNVGEGHGVALTRDTGYFWFFNAENVEMVLKVLDGCGVNSRLWVYAGGLTNVKVDVTVTDNQTGQTRTYSNPQRKAFQPIQDTSAFTGCAAAASLDGFVGAEPAAAAGLLLNANRFAVEMTWKTPDGQTGTGQPVALTPDTGYFWFFGASNVESVVKVLNGCSINNHYWVFAGGLTDVETELRVTDTMTGQTKSYKNPQHRAFQPVQDIDAFPCP